MMTEKKFPRPDYEVGYGKPPRHTRFKKGQTGRRKNSSPRSENSLDIFKRVCAEPVRGREGDIDRTMTRGESVLFCNHQLALKQQAGAMANMTLLAEQNGHFMDQEDQRQTGGVIAMPEPISSEEYEKWATVYQQAMLEERELEELKANYGISDHPWFKLGIHKHKGIRKF
jgi:hypothetical protein